MVLRKWSWRVVCRAVPFALVVPLVVLLDVRRAVPERSAAPVRTTPSPSAPPAPAPSPSPSPTPTDHATQTAAHRFKGMPVVGVLIPAGGDLSEHFCTAAVVDSPGGNLVVTAAHCLGGRSDLEFAPGYHDGEAPYGIWRVGRTFTDDAWDASADPNHDVVFLQMESRKGRRLQDVTGAGRLDTGRRSHEVVRVVGYPVDDDRPVSCWTRTEKRSAHQMEFHCDGFPAGTSGGPFIAQDGAIIGIIGGYERGGDTPDVSYSVIFGGAVRTLYDQSL